MHPVPPRGWTLPAWVWAAMVVVLAIQLLSGQWRSTVAVAPWAVLVTGVVASRVWVEPFRLAAERQSVDLALAEDSEKAYFVFLMSPPDEHEALYQQLFQPAVEAMASLER